MLAVIGTVPDKNFPLIHGRVTLSNNHLLIKNHKVSVNRGTPALLAAAVKTSEAINGPGVYAFLIGDIGTGTGSRTLYKFITQHLHKFSFRIITFHYLQPIAHWHDRVLSTVEEMKQMPILIADAGFMYAAKMSGKASRYDLFTPDVGELAFLADEMAPHPFYTRGFILHKDGDAPNLIKRAYLHRNASRHLLVKGELDYIANEKKIIDTVGQPSIESMEAIGGTGDSLTGLVTVLCGGNLTIAEAAILAAKTNRWIGYYANPSPATQVAELIDKIPRALSHVLSDHKLEYVNDGIK